MSAYADRCLDSARSATTHADQIAADPAANPSWLADLRAEEQRRWDRLESALIEDGLLLPDPWPAEDRAKFDAAREKFRECLVAATPRGRARLAALQAEEDAA